MPSNAPQGASQEKRWIPQLIDLAIFGHTTACANLARPSGRDGGQGALHPRAMETAMSRLPNIHPGEVLLEEFLKPLRISESRAARKWTSRSANCTRSSKANVRSRRSPLLGWLATSGHRRGFGRASKPTTTERRPSVPLRSNESELPRSHHVHRDPVAGVVHVALRVPAGRHHGLRAEVRVHRAGPDFVVAALAEAQAIVPVLPGAAVGGRG